MNERTQSALVAAGGMLSCAWYASMAYPIYERFGLVGFAVSAAIFSVYVRLLLAVMDRIEGKADQQANCI